MNKQRAQNILKENGAFPTDPQWRILETLVTLEGESPDSSLTEYCETHGRKFVKLLTRKSLCGWALHSCPSLRETPELISDALDTAAQHEFAACAQRKLALRQLNALAEEKNCNPIVFKGAANSLVYYDKESHRPSGDIDVMMTYEDVNTCFPGHSGATDTRYPEQWVRHLYPFSDFGYPLEVHFCFISPSTWGRYDDLVDGSVPLKDYSHLRRPSAAVALTLALIHFAKHDGRFIFDVLDIVQIVRSEAGCVEEAVTLWTDAEIAHLVMPGLTVVDSIVPLVSSETWNVLFDGMKNRNKREMELGVKSLSGHRFVKLRDTWRWSRITGLSIPRIMLRRIIGKKELTETRTGLRRDHSLFWLFHFIGLPARRLLTFWR